MLLSTTTPISGPTLGLTLEQRRDTPRTKEGCGPAPADRAGHNPPMSFAEVGDCWQAAWLIFRRRPALWLWMGFLASLGWIAFPIMLVIMRWIGAGQDYAMDLTDPGFLAQAVFVMATQWASAAGIVRMAQRQLKEPKAPTSAYIEGFFGGFLTFPPAALAAVLYDQLHHPGRQWLAVFFLLLLLPLHQIILACIAERGSLIEVGSRILRNLKHSLRPSSFALSALSLLVTSLGLEASWLMAMPLPSGSERQITFMAIAVFLTAPGFALHYLAWARYWQKITAVPAPSSQNP